MATAARELTVPAKRTRKDGQPDRRALNPGGKRAGAGRKSWQPERQRREVPNSPGTFREETEDEAWERVRQAVRHYVAIGYPHEVICRMMTPIICEDTLRKHFAWELENGRYVQDAKVAGTGYYMATSGRHPDMTRFWMRARLGWRDHGDVPSCGMDVNFKLIEGDDW